MTLPCPPKATRQTIHRALIITLRNLDELPYVDFLVSMPVFICEACNETLKKNKVDEHSWKCRGCWILSCMDCNKRFEGEAYKEHTTCVTEAERYQGHLYVPKDNKGEVKQQAWLDIMQAKLDTASGASLPQFACNCLLQR